MNTERREAIAQIMKDLGELGALASGIVADLERLKEDEQKAMDRLPLNLWYGQTGQRMEQNIRKMNHIMVRICDLRAMEMYEELKTIQEEG